MTVTAESAAQRLREIVTGEVYCDALHRALYSTDASIYQIRPLCVVLPRSVEDIVATVRFAAEVGVPIVARGGGSGLAGESLCTGIVMDMSRHLDKILHFDADAGVVTCQPGVILERLNAAAANSGWQFGPDPASGTRASIGGIISNNSTGAHSIKYGYTDAYVESLKVVLADGELVELSAIPASQLGGGAGGTDRTIQLAAALRDLLEPQQDLIAAHMPKSQRNRAGYGLDKALRDGRVNLHRLVAGSEGTLAVIVEATLRLVRIPQIKGLLQLHFASLDEMARAVPVLWPLKPATTELTDAMLARLARQAYPQYGRVLPPESVAASLLVEFDGDSDEEVAEKIRQARAAIDWTVSSQEVLDAEGQQMVWSARKAAVPLLFRRPGKTQPIPFIEDAAVPVERFGEYMAGLQDIINAHGIDACYYAHAGHGEVHTRPFLNLRAPDHVEKMCSIAEKTYELVWSLGGTISGEHGEGLVRAQFIRRHPQEILNPGKIINDDPQVMRKNLRVRHAIRRDRLETKLIFRDDEFADEIERCNGNGQCRTREPSVTMCPIFRVTGEEDASPRAHANMMRHYITGLLDEEVLGSDDFKRMADFCVNCKMCRLECPSAVNVPKLMLEAKAQYAARRGLTPAELTLSHAMANCILNSLTAPAANLFVNFKPFRVLLEKLTGIDRRRELPRFAFGSFTWRQELAQAIGAAPGDGRHGGEPIDRVAYFVDMFANYNDHSVARATIAVLRHNGIEVHLPKQTGSGMPAIDYGDLRLARRAVRYNIQHLAEAVRAGYKIVCSEPTAALCLKDEYLCLDDSPEAHLVAENTFELTDYLRGLLNQGKLDTDFQPVNMHFGYHAPCHLKAMEIGYPGLELIRQIPGVEVTVIERGCCGIAGTFGFQKKNFEMSMAAGAGLFEALADEQIDFGLSECSTCKMQMEQGTGKYTYHPIKVLAMAYGLEF